MIAFWEIHTKVRALFIGICVGLMFNTTLLAATNAAVLPASGGDDTPVYPTPVPVWGVNDYIDTNTTVYEELFPAETWDTMSTMRLSTRTATEGRNVGVNDHGDPFVLQVFAVSEFTQAEVAASDLSAGDKALWINENFEASIFTGLIAMEPGFPIIPVTGVISSSDISPNAQVMILEILDPSALEGLLSLWWTKSSQPPESGSGSWDWPTGWSDYWCMYPYALTSPPDPGCEAIRLACGNAFNASILQINSDMKAILLVGGSLCILGLAVTGALCLTNPVGCGLAARIGIACGGGLAAALLTWAVRRASALFVYQGCLGSCGYHIDSGCP